VRTHIKKYIIFIGMLLAATVSSSYCLAADFSNNALCSSGTIEPNLVPEVRVYSHFKNSISKNTADVNNKPIFLPKGCGLSPGAVRSIVGNVEGVFGPSYTVPATPDPDDMLENYKLEALGATKTVRPRSSDIVAANMAGRSDISREQISDLVRRARVGHMPDVELMAYGPTGLSVINVIGRLNTFRMLKKIASDRPTAGRLRDDPKYHFYLLYR
jgi:hypothetical protein